MSQMRIVCIALAAFFLFCAYIVFSVFMIETAKAAPPREVVVWTGPDIPKCDKELWDRIREGCDE